MKELAFLVLGGILVYVLLEKYETEYSSCGFTSPLAAASNGASAVGGPSLPGVTPVQANPPQSSSGACSISVPPPTPVPPGNPPSLISGRNYPVYGPIFTIN